MTVQIMLDLPDTVYQHFEQMARSTQRQIDDLLLETIIASTPTMYVHPAREAMQREVDMFEAMHAVLWSKYPMEYIAMHQGKVVDHDVDEKTLLARIDALYADKVVMIRQVLAELPKPLRFRSPHLLPL